MLATNASNVSHVLCRLSRVPASGSGGTERFTCACMSLGMGRGGYTLPRPLPETLLLLRVVHPAPPGFGMLLLRRGMTPLDTARSDPESITGPLVIPGLLLLLRRRGGGENKTYRNQMGSTATRWDLPQPGKRQKRPITTATSTPWKRPTTTSNLK